MSDFDVWGVNPDVAVKASKHINMKHGMFAGVPIICRDSTCPYVSVCTVSTMDRLVGSRCPMEAGAIVSRFNAWCSHFKLDLSGGTIRDEDLADATLIKDLVENEIQTLRAENRIAMNADFIGLTISQIDNKGKVYKEETVTPEAEYKMNLQEKRYKILQLLNATRKDKINLNGGKDNVSNVANSIFKKIQEKMGVDVENIDFDNIGKEEVNENGDKS